VGSSRPQIHLVHGDSVKFVKPKPTDQFSVSDVPNWPTIAFETDSSGPHNWQWSLVWGSFRKSGAETTASNKWDANTAIANCGGTLTINATVNHSTVSMALRINGANPSVPLVTQYLSTKTGSAGFDKVIGHESKFKHFDSKGEPIKSFDNGYGMCQLTRPTPNFEQVWNWKMNVDAGLALYAQKRAAALAYLSQSGRTYSDEQLVRETVCRWNGGRYHEWDGTVKKWMRPSNILCDPMTGNIGWDMNDAKNKGQSEELLHKRDSASYSKPPAAGAHWQYLGVCYADRLLD
jgi:hypothetical protein